MSNPIRSPRGHLGLLSLGLCVTLSCASALGPIDGEGEDAARRVDQAEIAPSWVARGCDAFWGGDAGARLCAVGSADASGNLSLARVRAIGAARAVIAEALERRVEVILRAYAAGPRGAEELGPQREAETRIVDFARRVTRVGLNGARLRASWMSPQTNLHTLVDLEAETFARHVARMSDLPEGVRGELAARADARFREREPDTDAN